MHDLVVTGIDLNSDARKQQDNSVSDRLDTITNLLVGVSSKKKKTDKKQKNAWNVTNGPSWNVSIMPN